MESDIKFEENIKPIMKILVDNNINYGDYPNLTKDFINNLALEAENYIKENAFRYMPHDCGFALKQSLQIMNNLLFTQMDNECKNWVRMLDTYLRKIGMQIDYNQMEIGNINIVRTIR